MRKFIYMIALVGVLIPSLTLAVWWNPVSWFQKKKVEPQVQVLVTELISTERNEIANEVPTPSVLKPQIIHDTQIIEKPVVQTITVQDPVLQKQINALQAENADLRAQIKLLNAKLTQKDNALVTSEKPPMPDYIAKKCEEDKYKIYLLEQEYENSKYSGIAGLGKKIRDKISALEADMENLACD